MMLIHLQALTADTADLSARLKTYEQAHYCPCFNDGDWGFVD